MAIDRNDVDERRARIDRMIAEFRAARQSRLKQGIAMGSPTEVALLRLARVKTPPTRLN